MECELKNWANIQHARALDRFGKPAARADDKSALGNSWYIGRYDDTHSYYRCNAESNVVAALLNLPLVSQSYLMV